MAVGVDMLRRYVIVNGLSTIALYGAVSAFVPNITSLANTLRQGFDIYAMDNAVLGPIFYRLLTVTGVL